MNQLPFSTLSDPTFIDLCYQQNQILYCLKYFVFLVYL